MLPLKLRHLSLVVVLAMLLGIWLGRALLAELVITSSLRGYGLSEITTNIDRLGLYSSRVARFGFRLTTETGLFKLEVRDAIINYTPAELADGRVKNLQIGKLLITYDSDGTTTNRQTDVHEALEPLKIIAALRQALREYIIFDTFVVEHVRLSGNAFGALQHTPLQLTGNNAGGITYAEFTFHSQPPSGQPEHLRQLIFTELSDNRLVAELRLSVPAVKTPAIIELNIDDTKISGNYSITPGLLSSWLQPFADIKEIESTEQVNGTLFFDFAAMDQLQSEFTAGTGKLLISDYRLNHVFIKLKLTHPYTYPFQYITLQNGSYIKADHFSHENLSVGSVWINTAGEISATDNSWHYKGSISTDKLSAVYAAKALQLNNISAHVSANPENIQADGVFSTASIPGKFDFTLGHSLSNETGKLSIKTLEPLDLNTGDHKLSQLFTPWPFDFDLLSGSIKLTTHAMWSRHSDFTLTTSINLDQAGGNYNEVVFSGLSFNHELEILPRIHSTRTSAITLEHLDSGVVVSNISTDLSLQPATTGPQPLLMIQNLYGELFDGSFSSDDFIFDLNKSQNRFTIRAKDIDLAKIVETQQLKDITVTGRIDGTVPVEINDQGVFIDNSIFINNVHSGTIRYNPAAATDQLQQNPLTDIALKALQDFRYSHLSADVNFTPEGVLTINFQLKGTSPKLDSRRPVHLNINTEQNLLSLLKSLRYAEGVSASIDQKVRRQYEKSRNNQQAE